MFKKKVSVQPYQYDREIQKPVLKCSICNGEQVAGFKNVRTGQFEEIMLVKNDAALREFMERCGIETITKEY